MRRLHDPTFFSVAVCVFLAVSPAPVHARARSGAPAPDPDRAHVLNNWTNVEALASGTKLRVELTDRTRIKGRLESVSSERLVILAESGAGPVAWQRDQVSRIEQRRGHRVRSGAGWGALVCCVVGPTLVQAGQSRTTRDANRDVRVVSIDELRRALRPGDVISVIRTTGDPVRGRLRRIGDADIDLQAETQQVPSTPRGPLDLTIPLGGIQALERPRDSSRNGALIGAGIGAGVTLAGFAYAATVDSNELDEWGPTYLAMGGLYTGLGALAGWAIDRAHSKPYIRFDARAPRTVTIRAGPVRSRCPGMAVVLRF